MTNMTNTEKADIFFQVAMEKLDLNCSDSDGMRYTPQSNPVADNHGVSSYICDCLDVVVSHTGQAILQDEMTKFGMKERGFGVWNHVPASRRQEARWFFLMLMVEYLDDSE